LPASGTIDAGECSCQGQRLLQLRSVTVRESLAAGAACFEQYMLFMVCLLQPLELQGMIMCMFSQSLAVAPARVLHKHSNGSLVRIVTRMLLFMLQRYQA
jgi:hypothetical protein